MNPAANKTAILMVCMGNICRSPTAEGVLRHLAREAGMLEQLVIDSAG
ncbi:MAG: low molecular weight phosphotyrosine protein phosphatase, partial [Thiobacillaceae bacterium]|nr:low molecular weight phosphotyrosine protein phosphatase [Thiobacillaceae bacterium]